MSSQSLGNSITHTLIMIGRSQLFMLRMVANLPKLLLRPNLLIQQLYAVGLLTLLIVVVSGLFVGMVLGLQAYYTLVKFGAEDALGTIVALSMVRELGPVTSALLFAGRAGSAVAAEIGLMRATEQLSGMELMAVDPIERVAAPRFLAGVISMPLLAIIFSLVGITGGHLIAVEVLGVDAGAYWSQIHNALDVREDVLNSVIKSIVFGTAVIWIAVFQGYTAIPTSEGVARATTSTVVISSLAVLALDFVLTAFMFAGV